MKKKRRNKKFKNKKYVDPYELKDESQTSYLKDIAGLSVLLGAGTIGATFMPTDRVNATVNSVDSRSQIVGSIAESNKNSRLSDTSHSDQTTRSNSLSQKVNESTNKIQLSQSRSISLSQFTSHSHSLSISQSVLSSLSLSTSSSQSLSAKHSQKKDKSQSTSTSQSGVAGASSNNISSRSNPILSQARNSVSNSELQGSLSKLENSNSLNSQLNSLELSATALVTLNNLSSSDKISNQKQKNNASLDNSLLEANNASFLLNASKEEIVKPTFSGTVWTDLNGKTFPTADGSRPSFTFRLSTFGDSTVQNPKFILMIPGGFQASADDITITPENGEQVSTQYLGNYGPNGEQLYMISVDGPNPTWNPGITGKVNLNLDLNKPGKYESGWEWSPAWKVVAPYVSELADDANAGAWGAGGGSYTFHVDGKDINVVTGTNPINDQQAQEISYTVQSGSKKLDTNAYTISNVGVTPHQGAKITDAGYEQLKFTFTPTKTLQNGDYFDVQLGLPGSNGIEEYDSKLGNNVAITTTDGTQVGTAYNMGTYYRVVFNSAAASATSGNNHPSWTLNLSWGNDGSNPYVTPLNQPSISTNQSSTNQTNLGKTYVYQYTNDESLNGEKFAYTPTNDVTINGQSFASGLHIQGQYVYDKPYLEGNKSSIPRMLDSVNRTWTPDGKVNINTNWYNNLAYYLAISGATDPAQNTGTDFDLTVSYEKNDLLTYTLSSDEELAQQIKDKFANYTTNTLSDAVEGNTTDKVYLTQDLSKGKKATSDVEVTHTDSITSDGRVQRVYHIKLSNPDIRLNGNIIPLSVSANDFTMPTDITSYQDDLNHAIHQGYYGNSIASQSAQTSNQALQKALINTNVPFASLQNNTTHKVIFSNAGAPWFANIVLSGSGDVDNTADPSNTRTASLNFVNYNDPNHPIDLNVTNSVQAEADSKIDFSEATQTLENLEKQGYSLIKVVNDQTGQRLKPEDGISLTDLSDYNYGNLIDGPNKFTVYLHFTDIQSISTSQSLSESFITSESNSASMSESAAQSASQSDSIKVSQSVSAELSLSQSESFRTSESFSNSASMSESLSNSASMSESLSNSVSMSESLSNSVSMSESLSNSVSMSESLSNSVSMSESLSNSVSMSESLSNSVSMSESLSNSVSMSESLSNSVSMSESLSNSVSMSESLSNSVSMSESLSNSVSMSESLSNSVSMSESLSNSVSMSESLSNSVSMSESLSNSVSMSESLSNSVSMSESLSNSVSMSESLSNSVSMSESLSNSVSMSESLSNSVSMSESLSNSVSMSESLSNSVSMSESLSNSVSMSESLSNSVSMSESLSNSVSMSESLSNSVSMSESLSNSVSMSESLSNSVSMSESLSNSVSMSESLSNSVSMSESLSNSVSMSESLSNSVSMSESLSNSVSMSESLSNSVSISSHSMSGRTITSISESTLDSLSESLSKMSSESLSDISRENIGSRSIEGNYVALPPLLSTRESKLPLSVDSKRNVTKSIDGRVNKRHQSNKRLPQTGSKNSHSGLLGVLGTTLGLLGLRGKKRRRNK